MRILFIGGSGLISSACTTCARDKGHKVTLINRGISKFFDTPEGGTVLNGDIHKDTGKLIKQLQGMHFDVVVNWIGFTLEDVERDIALFGKGSKVPITTDL
jgi:putative NADH-flavin reductase